MIAKIALIEMDNNAYKWAIFYDRLQEADYDEIGAYYHKRLKEKGAESGILLDLACGTGKLSRYFADLNYDVIGADISSDMLSEAAKNPRKNIQYLCQDMTGLDLFGTVDCCICVLDAINHLPSIEYVKKAFARVSLFMNSGGAFVFDINTLYKHEELLSGKTFVFDLPEPNGIFCVWQNGRCENGRVDMTLDVFANEVKNGKTGENWNRYTENVSETAYSLKLITKTLEETGFGKIQAYDWLSDNIATELSDKAVFAAVKL